MNAPSKIILLLTTIALSVSHTQATTSIWQICYSKADGTALPVEDDCTSYIYCLHEAPLILSCPPGLGFSIIAQRCVTKTDSDCVEQGNNETIIATTNASTQGHNESVTPSSVCNNNEERPANQAACRGQPFGELVPYPGNCSQFLVCMCEYPVVKVCQYGLHFDNRLKVCNWPQLAGCNDNTGSTGTTLPIDTTTTEKVTTPISTTTESSDCLAPEGMSADICSKYPDGVLLRYPYNCNAYINCTMGCPVMNYCQEEKVFNNFLKICDTPDTAHCEELPMPTTTKTTAEPTTKPEEPSSSTEKQTTITEGHTASTEEPKTEEPPTTTEKSTTSTKEPTTKTELPITSTDKPTSITEEPITSTTEKVTTPFTTTTESSDCLAPEGMSAEICAKYPDGILLKYPYNCNAYINCTMGCPVMNYCQEDKVFNNVLKICDTPDTAHCEEMPMPTTTTTTTEPTASTEESSTKTEEPTTITEEPTTSTEKPTTSTENSTTTTVEPTTTTEMITSPGECIPPLAVEISICANQPHGSYVPYPYDCTAYIVCNWECPYLEYCEVDKIFNAFLGICDTPDEFWCDPIPLPTTEAPTPSTTSTTTEATTTTLPPDVNPNICWNKPDNTIYPYEGDCFTYLHCQNGEVKLESCPNGWIFNYQLRMCDEASEDVCYTGIITTEEPSTTTTVATTSEAPIYDLCIGQPTNTTFPYPDDCQWYYFCRGNGLYYILPCPNNNYYDSYSGNCGPDVSSTACQEPITTTTTVATTLSPSEKCIGQDMGVTHPYEKNCKQYIFCNGKGGFFILNCPLGNYYYPDSGDCRPSDDPDICLKGATTPAITTTTTAKPTTTTTISTITTPEPTTSPAIPSQSICANASYGELIEYPDNCQKYISCVQPIPVGFYCHHNWYFDVKQQKCVPDYKGICSELPSNATTIKPPSDICQGLKEGDRQIYPTDCKLFYECLGDGYYMLKMCNEGQYVNPLQGQCSSQVGPEYCKQNFDTTLPPNTTESTTTPTPAGICANQPLGAKVSYPNNCFKYIVCERPIPIGFTCPWGLQFSTEKQKCTEPIDSDCGIISTSPSTTETTPTIPYNRCTNKPDFTLLPYEEDCFLFIICIKDLEHLAYCNEGQYFDLLQGKCKKGVPKDACRVEYSTTTPIITTSTEAITTTTTEITTTEATTTTQDPNLGPCYNKPDGTKFPYPNNCTKYIVCWDPLPVGFDCPEGLEFSDALGECVKPELANCSINTTTTTQTTTESTTPTPTKTTTETTIIPTTEETTTTPQNGPCTEQSNSYTYPYQEDCSKYNICLKGSAHIVECSINNYYNPLTGECDQQTSNTACKAIESTTPTTTTQQQSTTTQEPTTTTQQPTTEITTPDTTESSTPTTNTQEPPATTPDTNTTESATQTTNTQEPPAATTVKPQSDNICCGKKSGTRLPYPGDNTKFVTCQYPLPQVSQCPGDFNYDPINLTCQISKQMITNTQPNCSELNFGQVLVFNGDCSKYYFCVGSDAMVMNRTDDWYFNDTLKQCVPKVLYKCPW